MTVTETVELLNAVVQMAVQSRTGRFRTVGDVATLGWVRRAKASDLRSVVADINVHRALAAAGVTWLRHPSRRWLVQKRGSNVR